MPRCGVEQAFALRNPRDPTFLGTRLSSPRIGCKGHYERTRRHNEGHVPNSFLRTVVVDDDDDDDVVVVVDDMMRKTLLESFPTAPPELLCRRYPSWLSGLMILEHQE